MSYTWQTIEGHRLEYTWNNDEFDSIDECIVDAMEHGCSGYIYIGEVMDFDLVVDADSVIESIDNNIIDECGLEESLWDMSFDSAELHNISEILTKSLTDYLEKIKKYPRFKKIKIIRKVKVE